MGDVEVRCSFCGQRQAEGRRLITGPSVWICNECVDLCNHILANSGGVPASKNRRRDEPVAAESSRTVISSQILFEGPIFRVARDWLREPSGLTVVRDVVLHPGGAGGLPLFDDGTVALVRQYRHPAGRELLEIPAGRIEAGETPEQTAAREIEQEIGVHPARLEKLAEFFATPGFCQEQLTVYLATELTPTGQQLDHDEELEVIYLPLEAAVSLVRQGEIEDAKTIIALLLAQETLEGSGRNSEIRSQKSEVGIRTDG